MAQTGYDLRFLKHMKAAGYKHPECHGKQRDPNS